MIVDHDDNIIDLSEYRRAKQDAEHDMLIGYDERRTIDQEATVTLTDFYSDLNELYDYFKNTYTNVTDIDLQAVVYLFIQRKTMQYE
jgi:hypothetical protein